MGNSLNKNGIFKQNKSNERFLLPSVARHLGKILVVADNVPCKQVQFHYNLLIVLTSLDKRQNAYLHKIEDIHLQV